MNTEDILTKIKSKKEEWTKAIDKRPLRALLVPSLLAVLMMLNWHHAYPVISKMEMNLILLIAFLLEFLIVVEMKRNIAKIFWLIGAIAEIWEAVLYNFFEEGQKFLSVTVYEVLKGFCGIWLILFIPVFIYFIVVCIRVVRWTQEDWEKIKGIRREHRKKWLTEHIQIREVIGQYRIERRRQEILFKQKRVEEKARQQEHKYAVEAEKRKREFEEQQEKNKYELEGIKRRWILEQEYQEELDELRREKDLSEQQKEWEYEAEVHERQRQEQAEQGEHSSVGINMLLSKLPPKGKKFLLNAMLFTIFFVVILFYILIPINENTQFSITGWIEQTGQFMDSFKETEKERIENDIEEELEHSDNAQSDYSGAYVALAKYTIFYIALVGTAFSMLILLWKTIEGILHWAFKEKSGSFTSFSDFFEEFSTPFVVLIVALSVLLTMVGAESIMSKLSPLFTTLAGTVMCIIIILIATYAIRLIIDQSIKKGSFLCTTMHLVFILLIENVMGIVLGILSAVNLKETIHSLISFFLHHQEGDLYKRVEETMQEAINDEIKFIGQTAKKRNNFASRKSAFSNFSSVSWSRKK